ncbi:hypothetical protein BKP35_07545 [Anaerobacillus arseniciselenatis]|uniref:Cytochrome c-type protein n=1 Tax=Anaerobacillus arseniciselenatis TaxID=85682 RepID=A0A1S2LNE2_9BACI|nr:NapC/NirT family cytochrome c [Anaerobacillus arseniciselenatis]OIJ14048.1 hypothetical protein BKP35_07545 [Anaerobacillus arseniciselenatis]
MFKKINKKLFLIILGSVFAGIVIAVVTNTGVKATSSDGFCLSCHDAPEFTEYFEARPHAEVSCISCHGGGFIEDKVKGTTKAFSTITGQKDPNNYSVINATVPDETCLSCHNLDSTNRSDLTRNSHAVFEQNGLSCTDCHDGASVHGYLKDYTK